MDFDDAVEISRRLFCSLTIGHLNFFKISFSKEKMLQHSPNLSEHKS